MGNARDQRPRRVHHLVTQPPHRPPIREHEQARRERQVAPGHRIGDRDHTTRQQCPADRRPGAVLDPPQRPTIDLAEPHELAMRRPRRRHEREHRRRITTIHARGEREHHGQGLKQHASTVSHPGREITLNRACLAAPLRAELRLADADGKVARGLFGEATHVPVDPRDILAERLRLCVFVV